jgi:hypothetical protein
MNSWFFRILLCAFGCVAMQIASAQTIEIKGRIDYSSGELFSTGDIFTAAFDLSATQIPSFSPGRFLLKAGDLNLSHNSDSFLVPNVYAAGYTSDNVTFGDGNITGIEFDFQSATSPIQRFHGELYSLFPQNGQITDSAGMILRDIPVNSLVTNPWAFIDTSTGSYYWKPISYSLVSTPISPVPEPSAYGIFGVLTMTLAVFSRRVWKGRSFCS